MFNGSPKIWEKDLKKDCSKCSLPVRISLQSAPVDHSDKCGSTHEECPHRDKPISRDIVYTKAVVGRRLPDRLQRLSALRTITACLCATWISCWSRNWPSIIPDGGYITLFISLPDSAYLPRDRIERSVIRNYCLIPEPLRNITAVEFVVASYFHRMSVASETLYELL